MRDFKVALFDLDGTLVLTEEQYTGFWKEMGKKYRPDIPDFAYIIKGTTLTDMLAKYFTPDQHQEVTDAINNFEDGMQFPLVPGAAELVRNLKRHGVKCAVVTSSNNAKLKVVWREIPEFMSLFDKILTADDFSASKPDPDCFLKGAAYFGAKPEECVVFEDAFTGLAAGMASGSFTFGLTTGNPREAIESLCNYVLDDFHGVDYDFIRKAINAVPTSEKTQVQLPASKSISNRALVISALSGSGMLPSNLSDCDDTDVIVAALRDMPYEINIKAAGTAMRFLTAYLSVNEGEHVITGTERMLQRPIKILVDSLRQLGADIEYVGEEGFPPLKIRGRRLVGGSLDIPGNVSSQYISALLMIGAVLEKGLTLRLVGDIISRPYIDMTLSMMREFGAKAAWTADDTIVVESHPYQFHPYSIESDWSAASYWFELEMLSEGEMQFDLPGLNDDSLQGDAVVKDIFAMLKKNPDTFRYDFAKCPDLAQTIVCTCCGMGMKFDFTGLSTLKIKETDRINALKTELKKLGFVLHDYNDNQLVWDGERCEPTMEAIDTYQDHRMAMAFAPLKLKFPWLRINNPEVVTKSYPNFWHELAKAGITI